MNKVVAGIAFFVVTGGMYFVCANAHIDFFPCTITERDRDTDALRTREGTCSLLAHQRPANQGNSERLTDAGWAMLIAFCAGVGAAAGVGAGIATKPRR